MSILGTGECSVLVCLLLSLEIVSQLVYVNAVNIDISSSINEEWISKRQKFDYRWC